MFELDFEQVERLLERFHPDLEFTTDPEDDFDDEEFWDEYFTPVKYPHAA